MSKTERTTRVRYSRLEKRRPKNTLFTMREGDMVYFGIARCNVSADVFHKAIGTYIAEQRAGLAKDETGMYNTTNNLRLHDSGLRGYTTVDNVKDVVKYFRNIDQYFLENLNAAKVVIKIFNGMGARNVKV